MAPSRRKDVLWRAFGPLANEVKDRLAVDGRAFYRFPRASTRAARLPLRNGEVKPFGEVVIGGVTCRFGGSVERECNLYSELGPVSLMNLPHHADDMSPWDDPLGGLLVFFGPLHPGHAGELPGFTAKGSDGQPLTWGGLLVRDERAPELLFVRDDLSDDYHDPLSLTDAGYPLGTPHLALRYVRYDPRSIGGIGAKKIVQARALRERLESNEDEVEKWEWMRYDMEDFTKLECREESLWGYKSWKPSNRDRCAADWRPGRVALTSSPLELEYHGGHGSGRRHKCPLYVDTDDGRSCYSDYITNMAMDPDCGENELIDMSGLYYSFDVDLAPGPLSELFTLFVRVYFKPFHLEGRAQIWATEIHLDAPLPPLRPYAISISLRASGEEAQSALNEESYAYFPDNMIFK